MNNQANKPGTHIMQRCTVTTTKDKAGYWQLAIQCNDAMPSYKEIVQARYKYLPDDILMAQLFPPKEELKKFPPNTHILIQLVK